MMSVVVVVVVVAAAVPKLVTAVSKVTAVPAPVKLIAAVPKVTAAPMLMPVLMAVAAPAAEAAAAAVAETELGRAALPCDTHVVARFAPRRRMVWLQRPQPLHCPSKDEKACRVLLRAPGHSSPGYESLPLWSGRLVGRARRALRRQAPVKLVTTVSKAVSVVSAPVVMAMEMEVGSPLAERHWRGWNAGCAHPPLLAR